MMEATAAMPVTSQPGTEVERQSTCRALHGNCVSVRLADQPDLWGVIVPTPANVVPGQYRNGRRLGRKRHFGGYVVLRHLQSGAEHYDTDGGRRYQRRDVFG